MNDGPSSNSSWFFLLWLATRQERADFVGGKQAAGSEREHGDHGERQHDLGEADDRLRHDFCFVQETLEAAQALIREGDDERADDGPGYRVRAADDQHRKDEKGLLEIEGLRRERGDEMAPQGAADAGEHSREQKGAPAKVRNVNAD